MHSMCKSTHNMLHNEHIMSQSVHGMSQSVHGMSQSAHKCTYYVSKCTYYVQVLHMICLFSTYYALLYMSLVLSNTVLYTTVGQLEGGVTPVRVLPCRLLNDVKLACTNSRPIFLSGCPCLLFRKIPTWRALPVRHGRVSKRQGLATALNAREIQAEDHSKGCIGVCTSCMPTWEDAQSRKKSYLDADASKSIAQPTRYSSSSSSQVWLYNKKSYRGFSTHLFMYSSFVLRSNTWGSWATREDPLACIRKTPCSHPDKWSGSKGKGIQLTKRMMSQGCCKYHYVSTWLL